MNVKDSQGRTPLMYAILNHRLENFKTLIAAKADINTTDDHGAKALNMALAHGSSERLDALLEMNKNECVTALL